MGPFPERKVGKKRFILVVIDMLTRTGAAWAVKGAGGKEITGGLEKWIRARGTPSVICSDVSQATQSKDLQLWCAGKGVTHEYSPPYHHASLGFVERFNQTLLNRLRRMWAEHPRNFAGLVERAIEIYNETPMSSEEVYRQTRKSLIFGSPNQLWASSPAVWQKLHEYAQRQRDEANRRTKGRRIRQTFQAGDRVWLWNTKTETLRDKLEPLWKGPGRLLRPITKAVWEVRGPEGRVWVRHSDMLRPYREMGSW